MKFTLLEGGGLSVSNDAQSIEELTHRIVCVTRAIELFNGSGWKSEEVAQWLQYEKDSVIAQAELYQREKQ